MSEWRIERRVKTVFMICDICKEEKDDAVLTIDPYEKEVNDEIVKMVLCVTCCDNRREDI